MTDIDWTKPVICARGMDADPLFDGQGRVQACRVGSVVYAQPAFEKLGLRNVPAKPVLHEFWVNLYSNGLCAAYAAETRAVLGRTGATSAGNDFIECRRIAWNSDGSPVEDDMIVPEEMGGGSWRATAEALQAERDEWKAKAIKTQAAALDEIAHGSVSDLEGAAEAARDAALIARETAND